MDKHYIIVMISFLGKLTQHATSSYRYWGIIYDYNTPVHEQFDPARVWKMSETTQNW